MAYQKRSQTRKALTPAQQLEAAIKRAKEGDIRVIGHGTMKADGSHFWIVPSQSVEGMCHVVRQSGKALTCDCLYSAQQGKVCTHRAATFLYLQAEAESKKQPPAPQIERTRDNAYPASATQPARQPSADGTPGYLFKSEDHTGEYIPRDHYQHAYR